MNRLLPFLSILLLANPASAQSPLPASMAVRARWAGSGALPPHYAVREIGRSSWGLAIPNDINDRGVVVGEMDWGDVWGGPRHAVVWADGKTIDLTPDAAIVSASAQRINDQGVVAGVYHTDGSYLSGGFRWHDGVFEVLPTFAGGHQAGYGVSERGFVLGHSMNEHFQVNATMWDPSLEEVDLGSFGPGIGVAHDANGWDIVVGGTGLPNDDYTAFLWRLGSMIELGALPGHSVGVAFAINNHNEVVGYSGDVLDDHGFYWSQATGMIDLGDLGHLPRASADDINDAGVIVGFSYADDELGSRVGAVWHGGVAYDLNKLLVNGQGWDLGDARGVNEQGQIVGIGRRDGIYVAYLLTPVDRPTTTALGPFPGQAGTNNTIEVIGATPGADIAVLYGTMAGESQLAGFPGVVVDIASPRRLTARADGTGRATAGVYVSAGLGGRRLLFQAVDLSNLDVTNLIVRTMD